MNYDIQILIVDDYQTMRLFIRALLEQLGFNNIKEAENGKEALDLWSIYPFDLVISDWNMPEMNGLDLFDKMRSSSNTPCRFLLITGENDRDHVLQAKERGIRYYIVKPITEGILRKKMQEILSTDSVIT